MSEPRIFNPDGCRAGEVHIASYLVHVQPGSEALVLEWIARNPALECRVSGAGGKLVVVAEAPDQGRILDDMHDLEQQPGVLACTLVYHEVMSATEAAQTLIQTETATSPADSIHPSQDQYRQDLSHETDPS